MFKLVQTLFVALLYGSTFWQLSDTQSDLPSRASLGFMVVLYSGFSSLGNLAPLFEHRPVFYLQRKNRYYSPLAYYLAGLVNDAVNITLVSILFGTIVYWMSGLRPTMQAFLFFQSVLVIISLVILAFIRFLASVMPNLAIASAAAPLFFVVQMLFTGFVINKDRTFDGMNLISSLSDIM